MQTAQTTQSMQTLTENQIAEMFEEACDKALQVTGICIRELGWKLGYNKRTSALGLCDYGKKTVFISRYYMKDAVQVKNTMLHEVAHAVCPNCFHNKKWKDTFIAMGGSGKRCADELQEGNRPDYKWHVINSLDGSIVARYMRKPSFNPKYTGLKGKPETYGKLVLKRNF